MSLKQLSPDGPFFFSQDGTLLRFFTNKKVKYMWNNVTDVFEKLT